MPDSSATGRSVPTSPFATAQAEHSGESGQWIVVLAGSPDPQHFGPFVDEDEALAWGFDHLADFEPEEWEPYELSLRPPPSAAPGSAP